MAQGGLEQLFQATPAPSSLTEHRPAGGVQATQQTKDVKSNILSLFEQTTMTGPFMVAQQQQQMAAMFAQQQYMAAVAAQQQQHGGVAATGAAQGGNAVAPSALPGAGGGLGALGGGGGGDDLFQSLGAFATPHAPSPQQPLPSLGPAPGAGGMFPGMGIGPGGVPFGALPMGPMGMQMGMYGGQAVSPFPVQPQHFGAPGVQPHHQQQQQHPHQQPLMFSPQPSHAPNAPLQVGQQQQSPPEPSTGASYDFSSLTASALRK